MGTWFKCSVHAWVAGAILAAAMLASAQVAQQQLGTEHRLRSPMSIATPRSPRSGAFWFLALGAIAATSADLILSQRCERLVAGCVEGNPLFPRNRAGMDLLELSVSGLAVADSYWIWPRHKTLAKTMLSFTLVPHLAGGFWALHSDAPHRMASGALRLAISW